MSPSLFRGWRASGGWQFAAILAAPLVFGCSPPSDPAGPWRPPEPEPIRLAFDGTVLGADGVPPEQRLAEDIHVTMTPTLVTAGGETLVGAEVAVQLAPGWFLDERGLRFERNNELHVEGAYRREGGKIVVIASRVGKKGTPVVELRDEQGKPLWPETPEAAPSGSSTWPIEPTPK
jgi:hypothetical protein